jgi:hypothetical protein
MVLPEGNEHGWQSHCCNPGNCVHGRRGEQASEIMSVEILHREVGDKVGSVSVRLVVDVQVLHRWFIYFLDRYSVSDYTMSDINNLMILSLDVLSSHVGCSCCDSSIS